MRFEKPGFEPVMARLKEALGAKTYAEIGREIGLSTSAWANRKRANSIPYDELVPFANSRSISLEWLFFGEGSARRDGAVSAVKSVDQDLLVGVFVALRKALWRSKTPIPRTAVEEAGQIAALGAMLYNRIANIESPSVQLSTLRRNAEDLAEVGRVMRQLEEGDTSQSWFL